MRPYVNAKGLVLAVPTKAAKSGERTPGTPRLALIGAPVTQTFPDKAPMLAASMQSPGEGYAGRQFSSLFSFGGEGGVHLP